MDVKEEILKSIELIVNKAIERIDVPTDIASIVTAVIGDKYKVVVNGNEYVVKCGTNLTLSAGTPVWLHCPYGKKNLNKMYILAKR